MPFAELPRPGLEQAGHKTGGRVGEARRQVDGVRHIEGGTFRHHFGCQTPGGKFIPLSEHRLKHAEQNPDKARPAHKEQKTRTAHGLADGPHPGTHAEIHRSRQQCGKDRKPAKFEQPQQSRNIEQYHRAAESGQRQNRRIMPRTGCRTEAESRKKQNKRKTHDDLHRPDTAFLPGDSRTIPPCNRAGNKSEMNRINRPHKVMLEQQNRAQHRIAGEQRHRNGFGFLLPKCGTQTPPQCGCRKQEQD